MKTWTEKLPGIIAFIESGNGLAKAKAKKELEKMAKEADIIKKFDERKKKCKHCKFLDEIFGKLTNRTNREYWLYTEVFVYLHGSDECNLK